MHRITFLYLMLELCIVFSKIPQATKCKASDTACLKTSAQELLPTIAAGVPELKNIVLDPMYIVKAEVNQAGLRLTLTDGYFRGLKDAVITKVNVNMAKKSIHYSYHTDLEFKGHYVASGQILLLPVTGDGNATITMKNCKINVKLPFEITKNGNENVISLKSYRFDYDVIDNTHYHFTNLFSGNKALADTLLQVINGNWKLLTQEFGKPLIDVSQKIVFDALKEYLAAMSVENLIDLE